MRSLGVDRADLEDPGAVEQVELVILQLAERAGPHRQDDAGEPDRRRPQPLLDLGDRPDLHVDRGLVQVIHDEHEVGERRGRRERRSRRLRRDPGQLLERGVDPLADVLRLRRPAPDGVVEVESPLQAPGPHLGLEEQEETVVEIGVVADRAGVEVQDELLVEIGLAAPFGRAIAAQIIVDQRGLAGADHAQDAERLARERVVPEEQVEQRLVGVVGLRRLDPVLPDPRREIEAAEDVGVVEPRMIGAVGEDVRAEAAMEHAIDLEWPAEGIALGREVLDQRGVGHAHARGSRRRVGSDADARGGTAVPVFSAYRMSARRQVPGEIGSFGRLGLVVWTSPLYPRSPSTTTPGRRKRITGMGRWDRYRAAEAPRRYLGSSVEKRTCQSGLSWTMARIVAMPPSHCRPLGGGTRPEFGPGVPAVDQDQRIARRATTARKAAESGAAKAGSLRRSASRLSYSRKIAGMRLAITLGPVEVRGEEGRLILRIRNPIERRRLLKRPIRSELAESSLADPVPQLRLVVGEEEERRRGRPFLAHEEQGGLRRQQQQRRGRAIGRRVDLVIQPLAERPVADPVVVLDAEDEAPERHAGRVGPAVLAAMDRIFARKSQPRLSVVTRSGIVPAKSR